MFYVNMDDRTEPLKGLFVVITRGCSDRATTIHGLSSSSFLAIGAGIWHGYTVSYLHPEKCIYRRVNGAFFILGRACSG